MTDRKSIVLKAIVEDYVATREPVGSKAVVERHKLAVSPATVRNDMAQLEEAGLIVQPHTSAGRIPTDAGYRAFVDAIAKVKPLSKAQRTAINDMLSDAVDLDDVLSRAVRLLAQFTRQVAVVQYPSLTRVGLRHVELLLLAPRVILVVIITDAGRVEQRTISAVAEHTEAELAQVSRALNEACGGASLENLAGAALAAQETLPAPLRSIAAVVAETIDATLRTDVEERVVVAGTGNLTRYGIDPAEVAPVLDKLEEQVVLLRLLAHQAGGLGVRIGAENGADLGETSVVSTDYAGGHAGAVARLGVVGPTRMDYPGAMSSVYAVAQYLSHFLGETETD
ncbi:heat-inducible transcriptional repressor [Arcanobacterium wilhelmae]|uniref:Heat-inducible transcription repressor HrcA n=1 Tax=Arcanobacterium wilhelmae TaxID=1803177 RepID=A0ABT9NEW2_9ACTO|nr:heat-inducible transcriptional repressor HrcA [Arcanobacterium wilhelmae]MDP9801726.1 heat-inducible transcriptional repressor [Arcanobacterium wilhelmae]